MTPKEFPTAHKMFESPTMTRARFDALADRFRSPHLWEKKGAEWVLRYCV